MSTFAGNLLQT